MYYLKLYYKLLEWEWYTDANVMRLFIHCLLKANIKKKKWLGITIERGSFITSYSHLAKELGLSQQQIRTAIQKLETTGEITRQVTRNQQGSNTLITINNYNEYQPDNTTCNTRITLEQHSDNTRVTTTKECKNVKNTCINTCINECINEGVVGGTKKSLDPFTTNPLIRFFKDEYFKVFNNKPYLTAIERNKLCELSSDIEDFKGTIPIVLAKMKEIDFGFDNWKPTASWLLKDSNYTAILNGAYDKQKKQTIFDKWRSEEASNE